MASESRIKELEAYVADWRAWRGETVAKRDSLLRLIEKSKAARDTTLEEVLQPQVDNLDAAALQYDKCTIFMEDRLARARAGEDV